MAEVAEILKLNQQTIRNMLDRGDLPFVRLGRRVRIKRSDFDQFMERGYVSRPAPPPPSIWDGEVPDAELPGREHHRGPKGSGQSGDSGSGGMRFRRVGPLGSKTFHQAVESSRSPSERIERWITGRDLE